ncbi:hypothetical protein ACWGB8_09090 [Kitasatospora sp. NPDC054939]
MPAPAARGCRSRGGAAPDLLLHRRTPELPPGRGTVDVPVSPDRDRDRDAVRLAERTPPAGA